MSLSDKLIKDTLTNAIARGAQARNEQMLKRYNLREELQYTNDEDYKRALAHEILQRARKKDHGAEATT